MLTLLLSCNGGPVDCQELIGIEKDQCLRAEIQTLPATELSGVIERASQIEDFVIRGATISAWVEDHNHEINPQDGFPLCQLLNGKDLSRCQKLLLAAHLRD